MQIRLPRSSNRKGLSYALLINKIYPQRTMADAFQGRRLKPGANLWEHELWPTSDHSDTPLLLLYDGSDRSGRGHKRSQHVYILWQYDVAEHQWIELARAAAEGLEWVDLLRQVAISHLAPGPKAGAAEVAGAMEDLSSFLESKLDVLDTAGRRNFLGMAYVYFQAILSRDGIFE